jgi:hypothetical protein
MEAMIYALFIQTKRAFLFAEADFKRSEIRKTLAAVQDSFLLIMNFKTGESSKYSFR